MDIEKLPNNEIKKRLESIDDEILIIMYRTSQDASKQHLNASLKAIHKLIKYECDRF